MEPKLRFKEFSRDWEEKKLKDVTTYVDYRGKTPKKTLDGIFLITAKNIKNGYIDYDCSKEYIAEDDFENVMSRGFANIGDVLITTEAPCGNVAQVDRINIALAQRIIKLSGVDNLIDNTYLKYELLSPTFQEKLYKLSTGGTVKGIKGAVLHKMDIDFPSLPEQTKIADFLSTVDEKIQNQQDKITHLENIKKGFMQKIFSRKIRFKDANGNEFPEWEEKKLKDISERVTRKNDKNETDLSLTISAQYGLVDQEKYFNRKVSSNDLSGYYVLNNGEYAYNKSYSAGYPFGAIKRLNRYEKGAVSTLYICFSLYENVNTDFIEQYFESDKWYREIYMIAVEGARNHGLLNISIEDFFNTKHLLPCLEEQQKIADFLSSFDEKIDVEKEILDHLKELKKGLLQQMFV